MKIIEHIMMEMSKVIYEMQNHIDIAEAVVQKRYFSEVPLLIGRKNYALDIKKTIYDKTFYPSNKGNLERDFLRECDRDTQIDRVIKINENRHTFARFRYLRVDGMLGLYYPDFLVKTGDRVYVVETKAQNQEQNPDVKSKKLGAIDWIENINKLAPDQRMNATWYYVILSDATFYSMQKKNARVREMLDFCQLTRGRVTVFE